MRVLRGLVTGFVFALAACGGGGSDAPTTPGGNNNPTGGGGGGGGGTGGTGSTSRDINVLDASFDPSQTTVPINSTVIWTWKVSIEHNVTFANSALGTSGNRTTGSYAKTFPTVGSFSYSCSLHGGMDGTVIVQ